MRRNHLQLVKPAAIIALVSTAAIVGIGVFFWIQASNGDEQRSDDSFRPMLTFQGNLYGYDGEVNSLPSQANAVGKVEKSLGSANQPVAPEDGNLISNSFPVGSLVYSDQNGPLYVCLDNGCARLTKIE